MYGNLDLEIFSLMLFEHWEIGSPEFLDLSLTVANNPKKFD